MTYIIKMAEFVSETDLKVRLMFVFSCNNAHDCICLPTRYKLVVAVVLVFLWVRQFSRGRGRGEAAEN